MDDKLVTINIQDYFGPIMAACRKRANLSQEELAELMSCTRVKISKLETGRQILMADFLVEFCKVTNSEDAFIAMLHSEEATKMFVLKLKEGGYWPEKMDYLLINI